MNPVPLRRSLSYGGLALAADEEEPGKWKRKRAGDGTLPAFLDFLSEFLDGLEDWEFRTSNPVSLSLGWFR